MTKSQKNSLWAIVAIIVLALILYPKFFGKNTIKENTQKQQGKQKPSTVKIDVVKYSLLKEIIKVSGTVIPDEEVDLAFETSGKIAKIYFKEGQQVKAGQLLASLNCDDLEAQLNKQKVLYRLAKDKETRQKALLEKEAISQESYDMAKTELESTEAEIKVLETRIDEAKIYAPFDGTIGLRYVSEGAWVSQTAKIARLVKYQPIKIEFSVPERYEKYIKIGLNLSFKTEGDTNTFNAKVYAFEPKVEAKTRTLTVRALFENSRNELLPGRYVTVSLVIREQRNAIQIPTEAVIPDLGSEKVFIVHNSKALSVKIQTGYRGETTIEVNGGLTPGDSVITSGILQLRNESPVIAEKGNIGKKKTK